MPQTPITLDDLKFLVKVSLDESGRTSPSDADLAEVLPLLQDALNKGKREDA